MCPRKKGRMDLEEQPTVSHTNICCTPETSRSHAYSSDQEDMVADLTELRFRDGAELAGVGEQIQSNL